MKCQGKFLVRKNGSPIRVVKNGITYVGLNWWLNTMFYGSNQQSWYCGLIDGSSTARISQDDTLSSHTGWTEFDSYSEGARQQWSVGLAENQEISNSVSMDFTITAVGSVAGLFICSAATGTSGVLWSTGLYSAYETVAIDDTLEITYVMSATAGS